MNSTVLTELNDVRPPRNRFMTYGGSFGILENPGYFKSLNKNYRSDLERTTLKVRSEGPRHESLVKLSDSSIDRVVEDPSAVLTPPSVLSSLSVAVTN